MVSRVAVAGQLTLYGATLLHHGMLRKCVDENHGKVHGMRDSRNGADEESMEPRLH